MKILLINACDFGSTGTICKTIQDYINKGDDIAFFAYAVSTSKNEIREKSYCYSSFKKRYASALLTRFDGKLYGRNTNDTKKLIRYIEEIKPDLINIHCLNCYSANLYYLFNYLSKNNYPVILTFHAFFFATGNCGYPEKGCKGYLEQCVNCKQKRNACKSYIVNRTHKNWLEMKESLSQINPLITTVSNYVENIAKLSDITKGYKIRTILNGVNTRVFKYNKFEKDEKIHILFVCSDYKNENKGYDRFVKVAQRFENDREFVFDYIGKTNKKCNLQNVNQIGYIANQEKLNRYYNQADLFLCLSREETFMLPIAESLCSGTPIATTKCGGAESICIPEYSYIFSNGEDIDEIYSYIKDRKYLRVNKEEISQQAQMKYDLDVTLKQYVDLFKEAANGK